MFSEEEIRDYMRSLCADYCDPRGGHIEPSKLVEIFCQVHDCPEWKDEPTSPAWRAADAVAAWWDGVLAQNDPGPNDLGYFEELERDELMLISDTRARYLLPLEACDGN